MISVEQAQKILRDIAHLFCARSSETVLLEEARRRILAQDVHAPCDFPAFDTSAMDGFVFHRDDIAHHHDREKPIPICGEIASGDMPTHFPRGHALKIFTGAAIPYGANCVVPIEQCTVQENRVRITQNLSDIKEQQHIRPKGLNFTQKECVIPHGTQLNSMNMAVLASIGISHVKVFQKIKIAIGVTGNELIPRSGSQLQLGKIYDSNSMLLCQLCKEHGFEITMSENIPDRLEDTRNFLFAAAEHADVLLTTGGISMGDRDFIKLFLKKPTHTR